MTEGYRSLGKSAVVETLRKKPRFIGHASPCEDANEAQHILAELQAKHPDARHCCYAYRVARDVSARMSDDGEPQGTAGRQILDVLEQNDLQNACVVVIRYFGGTLLGAAGLSRAYRGAANDAVVAAGVVLYLPHSLFASEVAYADWPRVQRVLEGWPVRRLEVQYASEVSVRAAIPTGDVDALRRALLDQTAGVAQLRVYSHCFLPGDESQR